MYMYLTSLSLQRFIIPLKATKDCFVDIQTCLCYVCLHLPIGRSKLEEVHATAAAIERGEKYLIK